MPQLTKEQAIDFDYKHLSHEERAKFQMSQELACMPFDVFHESIQKVLKRPVNVREFGFNYREGLRKELEEVLGCSIAVHEPTFYSEESSLN